MDSVIPKRAFFFWVKNQPMSWMRFTTILSFCHLNPDWDVQLHVAEVDLSHGKTWSEGMVQDYLHEFSGKDYLPDVEHLGVSIHEWENKHAVIAAAASDIFAWEKLAYDGGWYFDMDILFIKPMYEIHEQFKTCSAVLVYGSGPICSDKYYSIGAMASQPDTTVFKDILQKAIANYNENGYQSAGVKTLEKHWWTMAELVRDFESELFGSLPARHFYALDWRMIPYIFDHDRSDLVPQDAVGIHWYGGSDHAQNYNRWINEDNYNLQQGTVFKAMTRILGT